MKCDSCGNDFREVWGERVLPFPGRSVRVQASWMECPGCQEKLLTPAQSEAARVSAARVVREREGLLSPEDIGGIRERFGLRQRDLEKMIGRGTKTRGAVGVRIGISEQDRRPAHAIDPRRSGRGRARGAARRCGAASGS
jgi:hypothetical protein